MRFDLRALLRAVRDDTKLTTNERIVLVMLATRAAGDGDKARPSIERLAADTGLGASTARRTVRELEKSGWLICARSSGRKAGTYAFQPDRCGQVRRAKHAKKASISSNPTAPVTNPTAPVKDTSNGNSFLKYARTRAKKKSPPGRVEHEVLRREEREFGRRIAAIAATGDFERAKGVADLGPAPGPKRVSAATPAGVIAQVFSALGRSS